MTSPPPSGTRRLARRRGVPGGRALLGGLLMAVAALGTYVVATADEAPGEPVVVAAAPIRPGQLLTAEHLAVAHVALPASLAAVTFADPAELVGRIALGPLGPGEAVQQAALSVAPATAAHEVALTLPAHHVAISRLTSGERVDLLATAEDRTWSVARSALVVEVPSSDDGSLTADPQVGLVVALDDAATVAEVVHALRSAEVTVVRSTTGDRAAEPLVFDAADHGPATDAGGAT